MKFTEIKELLDKGFTPDQIMSLSATDETDVVPAETKAEDVCAEVPIAQPEQKNEKLDERLNTLEKTISDLTKTIQANAIMHDLQPGQSVKSDMEILASVLNPAGK